MNTRRILLPLLLAPTALVPVMVSAAAELSPAQLFERIATVLQHPRCSNCHTVGDGLRAGDEQYEHEPAVERGLTGHGDPDYPCSTCHSHENTAEAPGAFDWSAPPSHMGWDERPVDEICQNLVNKATNGNRTLADLSYHLTASPTVRWAWQPGAGLSTPPLPLAEFKALFQQWVDSGGGCPQ